MRVILSAVVTLCLVGCVGPRALKKPDLSNVKIGDSFQSTTVSRTPSKVEPIKTGKHKGATMLAYEWDLPGDKILNRMYSYIVVRSTKKTPTLVKVEAVYEDPVDKYLRDPRAADLAIKDSQAERAYARNWRLRAMHNPRPAPQFNPAAFGAGLAAAGAAMGAALSSGGGYYPAPVVPIYQPPVTYAQGGPATVQRVGNTYFGSDGSTTQRIGNSYFHSDGTTTQRVGNTLFNSGGTSVQRVGNTYFGSDGTTTQKVGNTYFHSDGTTTQRIGNTLFTR